MQTLQPLPVDGRALSRNGTKPWCSTQPIICYCRRKSPFWSRVVLRLFLLHQTHTQYFPLSTTKTIYLFPYFPLRTDNVQLLISPTGDLDQTVYLLRWMAVILFCWSDANKVPLLVQEEQPEAIAIFKVFSLVNAPPNIQCRLNTRAHFQKINTDD